MHRSLASGDLFLRPSGITLSSPLMCLYLPNELLHGIIEYITYTPRLPRALKLSSFQRPPPELLALSVANWHLRRACLPFLFAKIKISNDKDAKKLENHLALCANFIKALFIGSDDFTQVGEQIISQVLPQLEQLLDVELGRCSKRTDLLKAVLAHPSVTSILVDEIPDKSMCNHDLSKVILNRFSFPSPADEKYFDRA
ncbi:hypothetical protein FB446DRAFT_743266 [Lentinula raphanica]|nr:hypothetical protein FB446DRAFT_743266 [Lentinula raphanica]